MPFDLIKDSEGKADLQRLQDRARVAVACYTKGSMPQLLGQGANIFLNVIADNLETFGHDQGSEGLKLHGQTTNERYQEAFLAVRTSRNWEGKFHLLVVSEELRRDLEDFGLAEEGGHVVVIKDGSTEGFEKLVGWLRSEAGV